MATLVIKFKGREREIIVDEDIPARLEKDKASLYITGNTPTVTLRPQYGEKQSITLTKYITGARFAVLINDSNDYRRSNITTSYRDRNYNRGTTEK